MQTLKQAWWAQLAGVLVFAQLWVALVFLFVDGTSNVLNAESTAAGAMLYPKGQFLHPTGTVFVE